MNRHTLLRSTLALAAVAAALLLFAQPAAACTGICEFSGGGGGFCLECVDAGYDTGGLCQQQGSCFCIEFQCAESQMSLFDGEFSVDGALEVAEAMGIQEISLVQRQFVGTSCGTEYELLASILD